MTDLTPIARWLETRRERLAMGRTEFAKHLGVDQSLYGRWIDEGIIPGSANLARIASALGVQHVTLMIIAGHVVTDQPDAARLLECARAALAAGPALAAVAPGEGRPQPAARRLRAARRRRRSRARPASGAGRGGALARAASPAG